MPIKDDIVNNVNLQVERYIRKHYGRSDFDTVEDLIQETRIGCYKALNKIDWNRDRNAIHAYLFRMSLGTARHFLRDKYSTIKQAARAWKQDKVVNTVTLAHDNYLVESIHNDFIVDKLEGISEKFLITPNLDYIRETLGCGEIRARRVLRLLKQWQLENGNEKMISLTSFLLFIVHAEVRAQIVWARTEGEAEVYAKNYLDSNRMNYTSNDGKASEFWDADKSLIRECWYVTSSMPTLFKKQNPVVPDKAKFDSLPDEVTKDDYELVAAMSTGYQSARQINTVGQKNPLWKPTWSVYRIYFIKYDVYAVYQDGLNQSAALAALKKRWITDGFYKLPNTTFDQWMKWIKPWDSNWMGKETCPYTVPGLPFIKKVMPMQIDVPENEEIVTSIPTSLVLPIDRRNSWSITP